MSSRSTSVFPEVEDDTTEKLQPLYHVILLNDEDHTYDYVIEMLEKIFGFSEAKAFSHAVEVDTNGTGGAILEPSRHMRDVLLAKGYEVHYRQYASGHDYLNWRGTLGEGLIALLGAQPRESSVGR